jgi:hypothetical protein
MEPRQYDSEGDIVIISMIAKLYLDDLERAIRIGTDEGYDVTLHQDYEEYASLEQIAQKQGHSPRDLVLSFRLKNAAAGLGASATLRNVEHGVWKWSFAADDSSRLGWFIYTILLLRERSPERPNRDLTHLGAALLTTGLACFTLSAPKNIAAFVFATLLLGTGIGLLCPWIARRLSQIFLREVNLTYRHATAFWPKFKDDMLKWAVGGLIGAGFTLLTLWAAKSFHLS